MIGLNGNGVVKIVKRKDKVLKADPGRFVPLRAAAESLSRANIFRAHAEVCNESLARFTTMAYEQDSGGRWVNIDRTGRIERPAPWGRLGQRAWGLRRSEATVLRALLFVYQGMHDRGKGPALFFYSPEEKRWYANLADFPDEPAAMAWVRGHQVTTAQWRHYSEQAGE